MIGRLARIAPGLMVLRNYRRQDLLPDVVAGLSVAAVALPVGIAYAGLAGFTPVVGLYSSMLPILAYALFGSSRQLIVGPDAATCALVAAAAAPLAGADPAQYLQISMALAFLGGLISIGASFFRLGALADFLSRPILLGFMNGIALSIALGQIGKLLGFTIEAQNIVPRMLELALKIGQTNNVTLAVGLGSLAMFVLTYRLLPRVPAALVVMALAALTVGVLGLEAHGVQTVGSVPAGLPALAFPEIPLDGLKTLLADAAAIALITFTSSTLTARSFAAKNGYELDADRDLAAIGAANIAAALSQGFAVSGADSRTAMNDAAGGHTQVAGLFAAAGIASVLLFFTGPLKYVPEAALGAVLIMAAYSLMNLKGMATLWYEDKAEFTISLVATLGVVAVGSIDAILFAVTLALLRFVRLVARPLCEVLGEIEGLPGFHSVERHPGARMVPGLCLLRFNAPIVFFNASYFKRSVLAAVAAAGPQLRWLVLDAVAITGIDVTGRHTIRELERELAGRGVRIATAGRRTEIIDWRKQKGFDVTRPTTVMFYPTLRQAVHACKKDLAANAQAATAESDSERASSLISGA